MPSLRLSVSSLYRLLALLGLCGAAACLRTYGEASTETGNPPVIDPLKVALEVRANEVHAVGKPHAVTPGGIEIEVRLIGSTTVNRGPVDSEGAFDVKVDSIPDAAFKAVAIAGNETSNAVYLLRDGSTVGDASSNSLSCDQRMELAKREVDLAIQGADTSCTSDSDCAATGPVLNSCYFSCASAVVSKAGIEEINASLDQLDSGLCAEFSNDGCSVGLLPCPAPLTPDAVTCFNGLCVNPNELCVWGVDDLLAEVGADVGARKDCGDTNVADAAGIADELACFEAALAADSAAQFTANFCIDCYIGQTYVGQPAGSNFEIVMEDDQYGDDLREATVSSCESIELDANGFPSCVNATQLYHCTESRSIPR